MDTDRLNEATDQLSELIAKAQKLATMIDGAADAEAADEPSRLAEAVDRILAVLDRAADRADGARERTAARKDRVHRLIAIVVWALTGLLVWIGLGQVSLFFHGRAMVRRGGRTTTITPNSGTTASSGSH